MATVQQFDLLQKSAVTQIQADLEATVESDRIAAQQARAGAELAETNAETAQGLSEAARDKAQQWAENNEDVAVETGKFSAKHYSLKAAASAAGIADSAEMLIKHEAEIASLENTINSANINQETTATVTGVDTVALPKTAANTGMQVQLFGQSAENLVVNGDFRNGTTGWTATDTGAVLSASNNILTYTVAATQYEGIGVIRATTFLANNKYYLSADIKTNNNSSGTFFYGLDSTAAGYAINIAGVNDSFVKLSGVLTTPIDRSNVTLGQRSARVGVILQYKNVMAINLTALGLDSLTKEQCDILFANYFEGSDNVLGTGRIRSVNSSGLLPSYLYFNGGQLRSNRLTKDEIRKGTNGYELVKRVGVGTLGAEKVAPYDFTTWTNFGNITAKTANSFTLGADGSGVFKNLAMTTGKWYRISISGSWSGTGLMVSDSIGVAGSYYDIVANAGSFSDTRYFLWAGNANMLIYGNGGTGTLTVNAWTVKEVSAAEAIAAGSTFTEIGSNVHFTLATPTITPISHAGLLNSNANGTAYFEPIIADAGVYASNIAIQLTDYPIASFESIRKYANGTYTELSTATAVIASGGLSFTHPDLTSGDLVMFTYAYNKESIGRSMTLTHYDSRFVIADTANSKVYRWRITSTNGVASIALTEV